jgi:L,D-transpeptidase YcbB
LAVSEFDENGTKAGLRAMQRRNWLPFLVGVFLLASSGCSPAAGGGKEFIASFGFNGKSAPCPDQLTSQGVQELNQVVADGTLPELNWRDFGIYRDELAKFYGSSNGTLPWLRGGKATPQARSMIRLLETAEHKGLDPEDYDGPRWDGRVARLDQSQCASNTELLRFDVALTVSTMRYISDIQIGRVNPRPVHFEFDLNREQLGLADFLLRQVIEAPDVNAAVSAVEPPFPTYRRTLAALKGYLELARKDDGEPLPVPSKPIRPGDLYAGLPRLVRLLTLLGDLPESKEQITPAVYQGELVEAVKHFQRRHGLESNGRLDSQTLKELNTPLSRRVSQFQLTLERWRWAPRAFDQPPIVVNIPEFQVRADDEQYHWALSMKVVVGKAYGHQTPVFSSAIRSVIFRPYWDVPFSILRAEMLPKIKKDPGYLSKNSYEVVDRNGAVRNDEQASAEMEEQLHSGTLRVRQRPGPNDSLGLVKFDFPNPNNVYMHGTPEVELFSKFRRDFSHGCIRVEDPVALAAWVLREKPEWTVERIKEAMNGTETIRVALDKPIPVLIVYGTAVVMENDEVHFFDDIYGLDAALDQELGKQIRMRGEAKNTTERRDGLPVMNYQ